MQTTAPLPVRVISDHLPLGPQRGGRAWPPECQACGGEWPCHTFRRNLQGQCENKEDRMRANLDVWFLRLISRPELHFLGTQVAAQLFGWIDGAVVAQRKLERMRAAARTGAQRALNNIAGWVRNQRDSLLTNGNGRPVMGQPRRGEVRYIEVFDDDKIGAGR